MCACVEGTRAARVGCPCEAGARLHVCGSFVRGTCVHCVDGLCMDMRGGQVRVCTCAWGVCVRGLVGGVVCPGCPGPRRLPCPRVRELGLTGWGQRVLQEGHNLRESRPRTKGSRSGWPAGREREGRQQGWRACGAGSAFLTGVQTPPCSPVGDGPRHYRSAVTSQRGQ